MKLIDLTGKRFGRLLVIRKCGLARKEIAWLCLCDCGKTSTVAGYPLRIGAVKSCGCLFRDMLKDRNLKHGKSGTPEYWVWVGMIRRCEDPKSNRYHIYGGRGINVCDEWRKSFTAFLADMGAKPFEKAQIDRINNDDGYHPGNCRWVTPKQQQNNRRNNIKK